MNTPALSAGFHLRPYTEPDLPRLLAFLGESAAISDCPTYHSGDVLHCMSNAWRGQHLAEHFQLCEDDSGALAGLVMLYPARYAGFNVVIHPSRRVAELEQALIAFGDAAMQRVMLAAEKREPYASDATECDTLRRAALAQAGFTAPDAPYMLYNTRPLDAPIPASILPDGFTIRAVVDEGEADALGAVHSGAFGSSWTGEEYRRVMRTPGFHVDRELVVQAPDGRLAAFAVYWVDEVSRSGLFEPVGCHRDFQRMGLTKELLYEGLRRMRAHGLATAVVLNLVSSEAAAALYRSVGFVPRYGILNYQKPMPAGDLQNLRQE